MKNTKSTITTRIVSGLLAIIMVTTICPIHLYSTVSAKDEETETVEIVEEKEVVFDHYFTEIDENLVNTEELSVTTGDTSIFTNNTNILSNYDNAYVISCASVEEARYVY